jgi:hypothetical protein
VPGLKILQLGGLSPRNLAEASDRTIHIRSSLNGSSHYTEKIVGNAERINQLHSRIHETLKFRDKNEHKRREWQKACADFHEQYDLLAFPGGLKGAYERIVEGDPQAMEAAICFLECRPYFFRSGYMFKDILRKAKRAPLEENQQARLQVVMADYRQYRESRNA